MTLCLNGYIQKNLADAAEFGASKHAAVSHATEITLHTVQTSFLQ